MKQFIVAFLLVLAMPLANAAIQAEDLNSAGFGNLDEGSKAKIIEQVQNLAQNSKNIKDTTKQVVDAVTDPKNIDNVVDWTTKLGKGLAAVAKELNVTVNEFAKSPVGRLTVWLLIMHFFGNAAMHLLGAILIWSVGFIVTFKLLQRYKPTLETFDEKGKKVSSTRKPLEQEAVVLAWIANALVGIVGLITLFSGNF